MSMPPDNISGRLNQRITLQQKVTTADGAGGYSISWQDVTTLWAEVVPHSTSERLISDKETLENRYIITIRHRTDINASMRFVLGSRTFTIIGIMDAGAHWHLQKITAYEEA